MKLSVVVPARNEAPTLERLLPSLVQTLEQAQIDHEVIVVNDGSTDGTAELLTRLQAQMEALQVVHRNSQPGFGRTVKWGLSQATGEAVAIVMGDGSDDPEDLVKMFRKFTEGYDVVFGSRFIQGARRHHYPPVKLVVNRMANLFLQLLFGMPENDITNAFKLYRTSLIRQMGVIESEQFDITAELPLRAVMRRASRATVPVRWYGRESGVSKLRIREMAQYYLKRVLRVRLGLLR